MAYNYNSKQANDTYMSTPKATTVNPTTSSIVGGIGIPTYSNTTTQATTQAPAYNFTQTPAQNSSAGNNAGYSGGGGGSYTAPAPVAPAYDPEKANAYIKTLFDAESKAKTALLDKQRQNTISGLNQTKTRISPYYETQRNTLAGTSRQNAANFAEYLANRGQSRGGASNQAELMRTNQLQANLGGLAKDEAMAYSDIENKKQLADQNYFTDVAATEAQMLGSMNNKLYDEYVRGDNLKYQLSQSAQDKDYKDKIFGLQQKQYDFNVKNTDLENKIKQDNQGMQALKDSNELFGGVYGEDLVSQMRRTNPNNLARYEAMQNQDGGYQAGINQATQAGDQRTAGILTALRNEYLSKNPNNPYANSIGGNSFVPTQQGQANQLAIVGANIANQLSQLKLDYFPIEQQLTIQQAQQALATGNVELSMKIIQESNLDAKLKAEIAQTYQQISASKSNVDQGWSQLDISQGNLDLNRQIRTDTLTDKKDQNDYKNVSDKIDKLYVKKTYDKYSKETGSMIEETDKAKIKDTLQGYLNSGMSQDVVKKLISDYGIN